MRTLMLLLPLSMTISMAEIPKPDILGKNNTAPTTTETDSQTTFLSTQPPSSSAYSSSPTSSSSSTSTSSSSSSLKTATSEQPSEAETKHATMEPSSDSPEADKSARVVIIGAGMAGLAAADHLINKYGFTNVTILEALDRVGGRIHPVPFEDGYLQLGAEFVHGRENPVHALAKKLGAYPPKTARDNLKKLQDLYYAPGGCAIPKEDVEQMWEFYYSTDEALDRLGKEMEMVHYPVGQLFRYVFKEWTKFKDGTIGEAESEDSSVHGPWNGNFAPLFEHLRRVIESEHACPDWDRLSFRAWSNWVELPYEEELTLDKQGYKKIVQHLEYLIPKGAIKPLSTVTHINYTTSPIQITIGGELTIPAEHVIVTMPLGHLKKYHRTLFEPLLPERKAVAIDTMGFGTLDKVFFIYEEPFWNGDVADINLVNAPLVCDDPTNPYKPGTLETLFSSLSVHPWYRGVLCAWVSGADNVTALEAAAEHELADAFTRILRVYLHRQDIPEPRRVIRSSWASQDAFLGSYSWYSVEADKAGATYEDLMRPILSDDGVPLLLFAGEATNRNQFQTTHGALRSGWREAKRLSDPQFYDPGDLKVPVSSTSRPESILQTVWKYFLDSWNSDSSSSSSSSDY